MEFITDFEKNTNQYSKKIKDSTYIEKGRSLNDEKGCKDICEIIISQNEIEYSSLDSVQKNKFIVDKKLDIASNVIKHQKYSKKFSVSLIQKGLQTENNLSSILYLNEIYKTKCIIYNKDTNKYYTTNVKGYEPVYCIYKQNSWFVFEEKPNYDDLIFSDISDLNTILNFDYPSIFIYKPYLDSLSKYKIKQLEEIAADLDISLQSSNGKKKLKKELYDDINLKQYIQDI
tara:strand:- start:3639 stop:4328 length:690 start_codon:yes stop_codon:yes gene_type:complete